jgi:integrator complex subunit 4
MKLSKPEIESQIEVKRIKLENDITITNTTTNNTNNIDNYDLNLLKNYFSRSTTTTTSTTSTTETEPGTCSSLSLKTNQTLTLAEQINIIFNIFNESNRDTYDNNNEDKFLLVLMEQLEFMILKEQNYNPLIKIVIKIMINHFSKSKLQKYNDKYFKFLNKTRNNKVINELLSIWLIQPPPQPPFKDELFRFIKRNLYNKDNHVRCTCLKLLALHYNSDYKVIKVLLNFSDDQDARVRQTCIESMIKLHSTGSNLISIDHYDRINQLLQDDSHQIRLRTTELICLLAVTYPEYTLNIGDDEQIRLIDDVFSKVCNMVNDLAVPVKVCANQLLGNLKGVSSKFLMQTLDKKLMTDLRVRKSSQQRQKQLVSSEWSAAVTKSSTQSDSPLTDDDASSLMASGACGAFIHGFEDEYLEVRGPSVEAMCKLAVDSPELAAKSIDFLVDMFNDEIETVRLKAIRAVTSISHYILLRDDQIDVVLSIIEDGSFDVRELLKDLLATCKLATKIGLKKTAQALFQNLRKYPGDKHSIWRCFQNLGRNHSKFVMSLIPYLVTLHPFMDFTEPDMNDIYYASSLIMIFNGLKENSSILPLLPYYILNHYFYLKLKLPDLIPSISVSF